MNFNIGEILSRALQIIRKHKVLWLFGILAGCTSNSGGNFQINYRSSRQAQDYLELERFFSQFTETQIITFVIIFLLIVLLLIVIATAIGTIGHIGLVKGAQRADGGAEQLTFGELWRESLPYFWRVLLLNLAIGIGAFLLIMALVLLVILGAVATFGIGIVCLIPLLCILVPLMIAAGVIVQQATIAIITEERGIGDGLKRGWEVVRHNLGEYLLMWFVLTIGAGVISLIIAAPLLIIVVPLIIRYMSEGLQAIRDNWVLPVVCLAGYMPVLVVLNGILLSYVDTAWTLTFLRLAQPFGAAEPSELTADPLANI